MKEEPLTRLASLATLSLKGRGCTERGERLGTSNSGYPILHTPSFGGAMVSRSSPGPGTVPSAS
jgi:hypothetical protein